MALYFKCDLSWGHGVPRLLPKGSWHRSSKWCRWIEGWRHCKHWVFSMQKACLFKLVWYVLGFLYIISVFSGTLAQLLIIGQIQAQFQFSNQKSNNKMVYTSYIMYTSSVIRGHMKLKKRGGYRDRVSEAFVLSFIVLWMLMGADVLFSAGESSSHGPLCCLPHLGEMLSPAIKSKLLLRVAS